MEYLPFPARLRSDYNAISEPGQARTAGQDDAIDFTSDFVPLLPLGTAATVDWVLGETVVQSYSGHVYLSSPGMLRLVEVDTATVRDTRTLFATNVGLPAMAIAQPQDGRPAAPMPARIIYLSPSSVSLQVPEALAPGTRLQLNCEVDFLTLRGMPLRVRTRVTLRKSQSLLLCDIGRLEDENLIAYSAYTARLETEPGR